MKGLINIRRDLKLKKKFRKNFPMTHKTGIIGCGRAGSHLALHLKKAGWPLCGLWDARRQAAIAAAELTALPILDPQSLTRAADILFLALPDDALGPACTEFAENNLFRPGQIVFHLSGSQPASLLAPAAQKGAFTASLHPLQSFSRTPDPDENPFLGILMTAEGMPEAVEVGLAMARQLGARGATIAAEAKTLYHAAAVVASNYLVTLMDFAFDLLEASGIEGEQAMAFLSPLVSGTLTNLSKMPPTQALTGPLMRGDSATLSRHMEAMASKRPQRCALYQALGRATLDLAVRGGHLSGADVDTINSLLSAK
jgi:predicted short-subunit dehydrogenase-like oxidoreductase (DUF2520 family)